MSRPREQVLRFAVGSASGPRSPAWRLWVPPNKSDVYVSSRRVANSLKVSLHEPGPSRFALTREHLAGPDPVAAPSEGGPRRPVEWERARPSLLDAPLTRALAIIVPHEEIIDRGYAESGGVVWTAVPAPGKAVEYGVFYTAAGLTVENHPGSGSLGSQLVGTADLANGQRLWVVAWERQWEGPGREQHDTLRATRVHDAQGQRVEHVGMLGFGVENGVGVLTAITLPKE